MNLLRYRYWRDQGEEKRRKEDNAERIRITAEIIQHGLATRNRLLKTLEEWKK